MCAMNPRLLRPIQSGFTPNKIAGLAIWLDAADASTVTISTGVSAWKNKVSGSTIEATQATGNNQPDYQIAQQSGKNSIFFDGSNDSLDLGDLSATFPTGATLIAAFKPEDTEYSLVRTANNNSFWRFSTGTYVGTFKGTRTNNIVPSFLPTATSAVAAITSDSSAYRVYVDKTLRHDLAADYLAGTTHAIAVNNLGTFYKGFIYEMLYYSRALNATEVAAATDYLQGKWGI